MTAKRFIVSPEVAGELGEETDMDTSVHPPRVKRVHYELHGWLGDDLLESFPIFVVTARLAEALRGSGLTGWKLAPAKVTKSEEFEELYPGKKIPEFMWLQVEGGDFGVTEDGRLEVSAAALDFLRKFQIDNAIVEEG